MSRRPKCASVQVCVDQVVRLTLFRVRHQRLAMFLDLERLGLAQQYYGSLYVARRREARKLGYSPNEDGTTPLGVELGGLLAPYRRAVDPAAASSSLA